MRTAGTILLTSLIVAVIGVYLVGQQLDARWAGGQGQIEPCLAVLLDQDGSALKRGEVMESGETFTRYQMCDGTMLYLDSNTQIRLSEYRNPVASQNTQLELIQGRVIVDGPADVRARNTVVSMSGAGCELVHYSWLDELDVTPLVDSACKITDSDALPITLSTTRYNTFTSSIKKSLPFSPETSSAQEFYLWTGLQFESLR